MKKLVSLLVAGSVLMMPCAAVIGTKDAETPAKALMEQGIIQGDGTGDLQLEAPVTRAEFARMLAVALKLTETGEMEFNDLPKSHWAYGEIGKAVKAGIMNGFEDGTIRPEDRITYEQAVKMVVSVFGTNSPGMVYPADYLAAAIASGAVDQVEALTGEELTRGDAVQLVYNALQIRNEDSGMPMGGHASGGGGGGTAAPPRPNEQESGTAYADQGSAGGGSNYAPAPAYPLIPEYQGGFNTEEYASMPENIFKNAVQSPLSTFSIDVDTASYSNMRRFLLQGKTPPSGAVRTEELINYFDYNYPLPEDGSPFSIHTQIAQCPWNETNQLALVAVQGDEITSEERGPSNLVFLLDVSGSMYAANKLPLVQRSMRLLLDQLDARDTVSIVIYASGTRVVLDSVNALEKDEILAAVDSLRAGGGTAGNDGLNTAYALAEKNVSDGNNRIILCTDGDFNIGPSSTAELEAIIQDKREKGIFLSVLGFGMGNYKDNRMETLADKGNGNYAYIDNIREAKKVLVDEMTKTLYTIAKDVKIQVEFNPAAVKEYRMIGYENRKLEQEDFENDLKDAGELGAGATVTALYELVPADGADTSNALRYQENTLKPSGELMCVRLRYKDPDGDESRLIEHPVGAETQKDPDENFKFAAAVAEFGMILNDSKYKGSSTFDSVIELARSGLGEDRFGLRHELIQLVDLLRCME